MLRRHPSTARNRGFTLLEMLVVIVLTALIMGLLMQVFYYVLQFRETFLTRVEAHRVEVLRSQWLHQVVAHVHPVPEGADEEFRGDANGLQGSTLAPLNIDFGAPTVFSVALESAAGRNVLRYREGGAVDWILAEWPGGSSALQYLDHDGRWQSQWPVASLGDQTAPLPAAVMLTWSNDNTQRVWVIRLSRAAKLKPTEA